MNVSNRRTHQSCIRGTEADELPIRIQRPGELFEALHWRRTLADMCPLPPLSPSSQHRWNYRSLFVEHSHIRQVKGGRGFNVLTFEL